MSKNLCFPEWSRSKSPDGLSVLLGYVPVCHRPGQGLNRRTASRGITSRGSRQPPDKPGSPPKLPNHLPDHLPDHLPNYRITSQITSQTTESPPRSPPRSVPMLKISSQISSHAALLRLGEWFGLTIFY